MIAKHSGALFVMGLLVAGAAGCTRTKANTSPDAPALEMPQPPPRDIEVTETETPPPMPLPQEPARNALPRPRPPQAPASRGTEQPKPEQPKIDPSPAVDPPKPPEEPAKPPPVTLQTTPAQADIEVEKVIRSTMLRATSDLNRIDYRGLNNDGRTQYETAKTFIRQAEQAIGRKNLEYARTLADKAAALAAQLRGR